MGAALFGLGWALSDSCPAPIAGQLAQGVFWSVFTIAGIVLGIVLFLRRQEHATRRAADEVPTPDSPVPSAASG